MKRYHELTTEQQQRAIDVLLARLVAAAVEGRLRFNDLANGNNLQRDIDTANAVLGGSPLLAEEYVRRYCGLDLRLLAEQSAHGAVYTENETAVRIADL